MHTRPEIIDALTGEIRRFVRQLRSDVREANGEAGPTLSEMKILRRINQSPCRAKDIAAELSTGAPYATAVIRRLEKSGMIRRVASDRDRREIVLSITSAGLKALTNADAVLRGVVRKRLGPLSGDEITSLLGYFRRING